MYSRPTNEDIMIPKTIHLCWFSNDPFPVEIKACINSWKRILPDFSIKKWTYEDAMAIGCDFIKEALENKKWAFAADAVRFYAVYKEGGIYMDSDILLKRRFDDLLSNSAFFTFHENDGKPTFGLQAAFFAGTAGNIFCHDVYEYYASHHFVNKDGTLNETISPYIMQRVAEKYGYKMEDTLQTFEGITIYPTHYIAPNNHYPIDSDTIGIHRIYGSWRKRKFGRKLELKIKHTWNVIKYVFTHTC